MSSDAISLHKEADTIPPATRLLLLQALALLVVGCLTLGDTHIYWNPILFHSGDVWHYYRLANLMMHGGLPYRDFALEYPPLAVVPFLAPLLLAGGYSVSFPVYGGLLLAENILLSTLFALILDSTARRFSPQRGSALTWYVLLVVVLSPLLPWRYDIFPALLTLLALRSVLQKQPFRAGVWLGLGIAAKLYPVIFLPILVGGYWVQKDGRANVRLIAGCLAAIAVSVLPFLAAGPQILSFIQYHQHRGIEIESLSAGAIFAAHLLWRMPVMVVFNYGAYHLVSPLSPVLLKLMPGAAVILLGLTTLGALARMRADVAADGAVRIETLAVSLTVLLLAFIVTNKVFSPQYMIWLLPFVPLLPGRVVRPFAAAFVLTILLFPFSLAGLLMGQAWAIALLNLRNLLMVGLFVHLLLRLRRPPRREAPSLSLAESCR